MSLLVTVLAAWPLALVGWRLALLPGVWRYLPTLLPLGLLVYFASRLPAIASGAVVQQSWQWAPSIDVAFSLRLDGFAMLFALLITGIGLLVTLYATAYLDDRTDRDRARFILLIQLFMAAMLGTVLSDDLIVMFVFWEATSLLSFLLIGFDAHKPQARKAALQSLLVTAAGGLALFGGILLIGMDMHTFSFSELASRREELLASPSLVPAVLLIMLGAFTKSAQFPFHFWLPQAMAAPTPASAYLHSATMVKLGIYLLARWSGLLAGVQWYGTTLVVIGCATMLVAALGALRATAYKALLAQSTVASLGILVMLTGLDDPLAPLAVCAFILAHALYKAALFFCAGNAIHATGKDQLKELGGLARVLPWTAAGAVLAGASMAGLPLLLGFIAKEVLFEAQLGSRFGAWPIVVAVLVNATMVALAGVAVLRPFFMSRQRLGEIHHGESFGMAAAPVALGVFSVLLGVFPGLAGQWLLLPAASALSGQWTEDALQLWHGFTPMLALSGVVVAGGLVLLLMWNRCQAALEKWGWLQRIDANAAYYAVVDAVLAAARGSTRWLQNGDMRRYLLVTSVAMLAIVLWPVFTGGGISALAPGGEFLPFPAALLLFACTGALVAVLSRTLVTSLVAVGVVGYSSALFFLLHGAPDLALTQFAVETLVLIVLMAVLVRLPATAPVSRLPRERRVDAVVAVLFGLFLFVALLTMLALPFDSRLSDFYGASSYPDAHGANVVNVIIVDYRALDTLGEIFVVGFATLGVWALLRRRPGTRRVGAAESGREEQSCVR